MKLENKSALTRGAEFGVVMGILFLMLFFSTMYFMDNALLSMLPTILIIAIPVLLYVFLRKAYLADNCETTYPTLVVTGISTFLCGGIILATVALFYITFFDPDLILNWITTTAETYRNIDNPTAQNLYAQLNEIVEKQLIPQPGEFVFQLIWLAIIFGIILSTVASLLISLFIRKKKVN